MIQKLTEKMIEYYTGDPKRIQHFIKVHAFSRYIGLREQLPEQEQFLLEAPRSSTISASSPRKHSSGSAEENSRSGWDLRRRKKC